MNLNENEKKCKHGNPTDCLACFHEGRTQESGAKKIENSPQKKALDGAMNQIKDNLELSSKLLYTPADKKPLLQQIAEGGEIVTEHISLAPADWEEVKNEEPWVSIEGALWDVKGGASSIPTAMGHIKNYVEKAIARAREEERHKCRIMSEGLAEVKLSEGKSEGYLEGRDDEFEKLWVSCLNKSEVSARVLHPHSGKKKLISFIREQNSKAREEVLEICLVQGAKDKITNFEAGRASLKAEVEAEIKRRMYVFERPKDDYLPEVYKHLKSKNEALTDLRTFLDTV